MTIYIFCLIETEGNESGDHGAAPLQFIYGRVTRGRGQSGHIASNEDSDV